MEVLQFFVLMLLARRPLRKGDTGKSSWRMIIMKKCELTEDELSMINETLAKIKVAGSRVGRVKKDY